MSAGVEARAYFAQLAQLAERPTWDGNVIDKAARTQLVTDGLAWRSRHGWNGITARGAEAAVEAGAMPEPPR